ncbi:hypothetical protein M899_0329 [Bacteriovorax sp. BSW11_IV]|uniref:hypothetical protein n=1 Tax=Bacteriovorax sp. BSW11_IV TaxID=1353529 RepID=UPI00038A0204|nr:hypothetical protein [Bacteriovorax sp. BSW11_IV]EQC50271.1 hypothetical protein M899_0329 [Bacteriovorax sp. BSW11_IV]
MKSLIMILFLFSKFALANNGDKSISYPYFTDNDIYTKVELTNDFNPDLPDIFDYSDDLQWSNTQILNPQLHRFFRNMKYTWQEKDERVIKVNKDYLNRAVDWEIIDELNEKAKSTWAEALALSKDESTLKNEYKEYIESIVDDLKFAKEKNPYEKKGFFQGIFNKKKKKKLPKSMAPISEFRNEVFIFLSSSDILPTHGLTLIEKLNPLFVDTLMSYIYLMQIEIFESKYSNFNIEANKREIIYNTIHQLLLIAPDKVKSASITVGRQVENMTFSFTEIKVASSSLIILGQRFKECSNGILTDLYYGHLKRGVDFSYRMVSWKNLNDWVKVVYDVFYAASNNSKIFCK